MYRMPKRVRGIALHMHVVTLPPVGIIECARVTIYVPILAVMNMSIAVSEGYPK